MKIFNIKYHIYFWLFEFFKQCFIHFSTYETRIYWYSLVIIVYNNIVKMIVFYTTLKIFLPLFFQEEKYFKFFLSLFIFLISISIVKTLIDYQLPLVEGDNSAFNFWGVDSFYVAFEVIIPVPFAFVLYYIEKITQQQESQRIIEQENFNLGQSIINTELSNLKNQINPDFLFRKLDYFYQESLPHSPNLSKGISLLSDMMHYAIDDDDDEGKVPLANEITHIRNFIEINQLRFDGRLQVDFEVLGEVSSLKIMPLILITFVENAFKYGELMDTQNPLKIHLELKENKLFFSTYNRTRRGPKEQSEGIGMANTQKRLALGYPKQHHLLIKSEIEFYKVELEIELT